MTNDKQPHFEWNEDTAIEYGKFCVLNNSYMQWEDFKQSIEQWLSDTPFVWTTQLVNEFACKLVMSKQGVGYTAHDFIKEKALNEDTEKKNIEAYAGMFDNEDSVVPSVDEAGVIAVRISERLYPKLTSREQAIFIAGFQECIKWLKSKTDTVVEDKGFIGEELVELLRDCVSSTWGNPSLDKTQILFEKFLYDRKLVSPTVRLVNAFLTDSVNRNIYDKEYSKKEVDEIRNKAWCSGKYGNHQTYHDYINSAPTPTTVKEQEQKDWEIVSFKGKKTDFIYTKSESGEYCYEDYVPVTLGGFNSGNSGCDIHSVKRLK